MRSLIDGIFPGNLKEVIAVVRQESTTLAAREVKLVPVTQTDVASFARRESVVASLPEVLGQERIYVFIKIELDLAHRWLWGKRLAQSAHDKLAFLHVKTKTQHFARRQLRSERILAQVALDLGVDLGLMVVVVRKGIVYLRQG